MILAIFVFIFHCDKQIYGDYTAFVTFSNSNIKLNKIHLKLQSNNLVEVNLSFKTKNVFRNPTIFQDVYSDSLISCQFATSDLEAFNENLSFLVFSYGDNGKWIKIDSQLIDFSKLYTTNVSISSRTINNFDIKNYTFIEYDFNGVIDTLFIENKK
jgi:hypothetical protein